MSVIDHGWEQKEEDNDSKHYSNRDGQHMPDVIELQHKNGMAGEAAAWAILTMGGIEDVTVPNIGHVPRTQRNHLPDMDLIDCKTVTRAKWKDGWVVQFDKTFPALKRQFHSLWIRVPVVLMVADWGSNAGQTVRMLGLCTWGFFRENMDAMQNDRYNSTKRALYPGNKLTGARDERFIPVSWWEDKTSEPDWDFFLDQQKIL
jgi:hypothetical protein